MDHEKGEEGKKILILKTWERCRSLLGGRGTKSSAMPCNDPWSKSKSKGDKRKMKSQDGPDQGCFSVCVGAEKQRFVVKTEYVNHPLFKMLLEDAALEYRYNYEGPILLPCDVDLFYKVLAEIESKETRPG